ncbi:MAG TPA: hypothetical protein VN426_15345 [Syntrophomonadaceae bacterium]|nr:hypothetical protein [Syntrophomonadaceae bacterium]
MNYLTAIRGHDINLSLLKKALDNQRVSHAYLFLGPPGVGKMLTARAFASHLIAAGDSEAQLFFEQGMHPDLLMIEKPDNRSLLGIEQITRDVEPWLALKPFRSGFRVVIIRDAQLLSEPAGNALLKVLEEPPPYAVIILVADESNLLETITSRCQLLRFFPVSEEAVVSCLLEQGIDRDSAQRAAQLGQGSVGRSWRFASEEGFSHLWDEARQMVKDLGQGKPVQVFLTAEKMESHPEILSTMLETILRDIYIYRLLENPALLLIPENLSLARSFSGADPRRIMSQLQVIARLQRHYRQNVNALLLNINVAYAARDALVQ